MNANEALRYLAHEAALCHNRDAHEAFVLLLPALSRVLGQQAMDDLEVLIFEREFLQLLQRLPSTPKNETEKSAGAQ